MPDKIVIQCNVMEYAIMFFECNRRVKMQRHWKVQSVLLLLIMSLLWTGCAQAAAPAYQKFSGVFYNSFDTITSFIGYAQEKETFDDAFEMVQDMFARYHEVFDGYNAYEGVNNLYHVNKHAGEGPVQAEKELIDLLLWLREKQPMTNGKVNVALGTVLRIWHNYRTAGVELPQMSELENALAHTDFDKIIIDEENGTVHFTDPEIRLDLGAVAKGYTVEIVSQRLLTSDMPSFIISAGGNVRCGQKPLDGRNRWGVGIQNPEMPSTNKDVMFLTGLSVVTSGDYQRYYTVDGVRYHHLIDPVTLMPGTHMRAVTIVTEDSGLADLLSTAVFLMPYEEGRAYVDSLDGVEAYWVLNDGSVRYTDGMGKMLSSLGATAKD